MTDTDLRPLAELGCLNPECKVCAALAYVVDEPADQQRAMGLVAAIDVLLGLPAADRPRDEPYARLVRLSDGLWYDRADLVRHVSDIAALAHLRSDQM